MRSLLPFATLTAVLSWQGFANAHIQMQSPPARYLQDNNGLKEAPCGSGTKSNAVTPLVPGQTLTVKWKESISHAGHFRIALAASDADFTDPTSLDVPATPPDWVLADGIQDKTGRQDYSYDVTIPDRECPKCVLQLLQVMSNGTDGTNTGPFSGIYHACADVSIGVPKDDAGPGDDAAKQTDARTDAGARDALGGDAARAVGGASGDAMVREDTGAGSGGRPGTGGSTGTGETASGGGSGGSSASGSGGAGEGGAAGSGGSSMSGSTGGTGGNSATQDGSGGNSGRGGDQSATTAASGGASGTGGASGPAEVTSDQQGCACRMGAPRQQPSWPSGLAAALLLAAFGLGWQRRREHRDEKRRPRRD